MTVPFTIAEAARIVKVFGRCPTTNAVPVLPPDATEEQWRAARRYAVGASEISAVLGVSPYKSPFTLWWEKHEGWQTDRTQAMHIGHKLESVIADLFGEYRPDLVLARTGAALWAHPDREWMVCTPDYLAVRMVHADPWIEPVECKSDEGGPGWGPSGSDEVPYHHRLQVWWQCSVFGAPRGHLVRLYGKRFAAYTIEYDDRARDEIAQALRAASRFLGALSTGVAPDIDAHPSTEETLKNINPAVEEGLQASLPSAVVDRYRAACRDKADADERWQAAKIEVRYHLRNAEVGVHRDGWPVVRRYVGKRRGYQVPPSTVDKLIPLMRRGARDG